jgi:hypothetical protein
MGQQSIKETQKQEEEKPVAFAAGFLIDLTTKQIVNAIRLSSNNTLKNKMPHHENEENRRKKISAL